MWMTTKCANDFNDTVQIILRDKRERPEQFTDVDTKIPVTDNITNDIYRNMYCALCNFVVEEKMVYWDASVECSKAVLLPSSMKKIVQEVDEIPECNIIYKHPKMEGNLPECTYKITECNVTENLEVYDPVVEAACHAYTAVFDFKYNNIFCYLCNEPGFSAPGVCIKTPDHHVMISFTALLRFKPPPEDVTRPDVEDLNSCRKTQIYDPLKVMRFLCGKGIRSATLENLSSDIKKQNKKKKPVFGHKNLSSDIKTCLMTLKPVFGHKKNLFSDIKYPVFGHKKKTCFRTLKPVFGHKNLSLDIKKTVFGHKILSSDIKTCLWA